MDRRRRRVLAGAGSALAAGLAGCVLLGDGPATVRAAPARVRPSALAGTGYGAFRTAEVVLPRVVRVGPLRREVKAVGRVAEYDRAVTHPGLGRLRAAAVAVPSAPRIRTLGRSFDPLAGLGPASLAERAQAHYGAVVDLAGRESRAVGFLGRAVVGPVDHRGDRVGAVSVRPRGVAGDERVRRLLEGVAHPPDARVGPTEES